MHITDMLIIPIGFDASFAFISRFYACSCLSEGKDLKNISAEKNYVSLKKIYKTGFSLGALIQGTNVALLAASEI